MHIVHLCRSHDPHQFFLFTSLVKLSNWHDHTNYSITYLVLVPQLRFFCIQKKMRILKWTRIALKMRSFGQDDTPAPTKYPMYLPDVIAFNQATQWGLWMTLQTNPHQQLQPDVPLHHRSRRRDPHRQVFEPACKMSRIRYRHWRWKNVKNNFNCSRQSQKW